MFFPPVFPLVLCSGLSSDNVIKCAGHTASARFTRNQNNNKPTSSKQSNFENPDVCGRDFVFLPDRIKKNKKLDCSNQSTRFPLQGYKGKHQEHRLSTRRKITNGWLRVKSIHHVKQAGTDLQRESWTRPTRVETSGNNRVALLVNSFNASLSVKVN